ncbi:hypothetical protein DYD21_15025 [Rhodohalobacter sp. SW132]|uniref:M20/M25/M40 family metallo-hydrolase n=1 Tax=Rhodohalobacter sp. SW132 TaxID=2293433 RepID=UPI000E2662E7|nr:M20/M25/M40 family metallo-hydrolase [Rhodohalobacter sp. SW132]REL29164.1 hypothetical protein DYD21_15025 [Rhodohalobacter sp. SW132]
MTYIRATILTIIAAVFVAAAYVSDPYFDAYLKWDAGDYPAALEQMIEILEGPQADQYFDEIATLTGELYRVDTVAVDGRNPVFSPDNRHFSWEEENGVTQIAEILEDSIQILHTLDGSDLIFSPAGNHAIIQQVQSTEKALDLQQQLQDAFDARDRAGIFRARDALQYEQALHRSFVLVDLESGRTDPINTNELIVQSPAFAEDGSLYFAGMNPNEPVQSDIYKMDLTSDTAPERITAGENFFDYPRPLPDGGIIATINPRSTFPTDPERETHQTETEPSVVLLNGDGTVTKSWIGESPVLSKSGNRLAFMTESGGENHIHSADLSGEDYEAITLVSSEDAIQNPALSPDGSKLAFMIRSGISWDIHLVHTADGSEEPLTFDIQHELFPHFLDDERVLGMMGEARHRRSHIYDVSTKEFYRLFHNNSVRTVSMEYEWEPSPDGKHLLVVAERDGNTITPERGVYLVRIGERISREAMLERLRKNLENELDLRSRAENMYEPIYDEVRSATQEVNITRLYHYQKSLYDFGSKHMTQPGNQKASEYIYETLKSFGYEPELQWFSPSGDIETANVIARLEGTEHPEVVYILSSHFDSVLRSPGADDNSTGTAVLLEAARVLAENPQPATIIFASLTAEESGLLGAREFVRVADQEGLTAAGVINNDMMGWTRHHRLDDTIRFSNYGIRDVQHSGAILFSDLITYDSRYYRNTDAHVFFDAYGDVIGGIGSYPILGNPNYHQPTDRLETINHNLVQEVARSTTATLMMLSNAPSKVTGLEYRERSRSRTELSWNPSAESDIDFYRVSFTHRNGEKMTEETASEQITIRNADLSKEISVVAVNNRGITGWDPSRLETE